MWLYLVTEILIITWLARSVVFPTSSLSNVSSIAYDIISIYKHTTHTTTNPLMILEYYEVRNESTHSVCCPAVHTTFVNPWSLSSLACFVGDIRWKNVKTAQDWSKRCLRTIKVVNEATCDHYLVHCNCSCACKV